MEQSGLQRQGIWGTVWNGSISQRRQTVATCSVQLSPWGIRDPLCCGNSSCSFSLYLKEIKLGSHTVRPVNGSPWGKGLENPLILKPLVEDQISFLSYHNKMPQIGWLNQQKFIFFFFCSPEDWKFKIKGFAIWFLLRPLSLTCTWPPCLTVSWHYLFLCAQAFLELKLLSACPQISSSCKDASQVGLGLIPS